MTRASAVALLACCASGTLAAVVFEPAPSKFESALYMLAGASMKSTVGPVAVEGDGVLRYTTGLYPPETIDLNLPELRSASPLAALQWSNRWREMIEGVFGGEREMVAYWEQGATSQGDPQFSVFNLGDEFLNSGSVRASVESLSLDQPGAGAVRAVQFARGNASGGGGGGGSQFSPFGVPANPQPTNPGGPIVDPGTLPDVGSPGEDDPTQEAPSETPSTQPPRIGLIFDDIEWIDPTFNRTPAPPRPENDAGDPFDNDGLPVNAPVAIPTPTGVGLGLAGLLTLGAVTRRRRWIA